MKPVIAITIGDFNGIGPELALKAAAHASVRRACVPLLIGPLAVFEHLRTRLKVNLKMEKAPAVITPRSAIPVVDVGDAIPADVQPGIPTKASGKTAGLAIETAVRLCLERKVHAIVTAPASKKALHLAGYNFPGQTEMIALFSRSQRVAMMLVSKTLRVGLVTIHVPIRTLVENLSREKIIEKATIVLESLKNDFRISGPRLAVLGLNPHAGEDGILGTEEKEFIAPAVEHLRAQGFAVDGPFAADGFFGRQGHKSYDAVLAMYHDQGLIPLKLSSFGRAVNFSAGLSVLRTSPDHGTAYDIAGQGKANMDSMLEAIKLAIQFAKNRHD